MVNTELNWISKLKKVKESSLIYCKLEGKGPLTTSSKCPPLQPPQTLLELERDGVARDYGVEEEEESRDQNKKRNDDDFIPLCVLF